MKLVSIETIPGQEFEAMDVVKGTVVYSKNIGHGKWDLCLRSC